MIYSWGPATVPYGFIKETYTDHLVGMIHHGDEHIEEDEDIYDAIGAKHGHSPESGITLDSCII